MINGETKETRTSHLETQRLIEGMKVVVTAGNLKGWLGLVVTTIPIRGKVMVLLIDGAIPKAIKVKHLVPISDNRKFSGVENKVST